MGKLIVFQPKKFEWPDETFMRELWEHLGASYCDWGYGVNRYPIDYSGELGIKKAKEFCDAWNEKAGKYLLVEEITFEPETDGTEGGTVVVKYQEQDYFDYVPENQKN